MKIDSPVTLFTVLVGVILIFLPWILPAYFLTLIIRILFFGLLAMSLAFLAGQGGMVSLGQTAFFGTSAYAVALLSTRLGFSLPYAFVIAVVIATLLGVLFGVLAIKTHGVYFLMLTLALGQIMWGLSYQWISVTRAYDGLPGVRAGTVAGINFNVPVNFYFLLLAVFIGVVYLLKVIVNSSFGLALRGVRESPSRMEALGYPVFLIRYLAFVFSAMVAGIAGVFYAYFTGIVNPAPLDLTRAVWVLMVTILGGMEFLSGAILGTTIVVFMEILISQVTERYMIVIGVVFLMVILFAPEGIMGYLYSKKRTGKRGKKFWELIF